jgi:hypothetical protein
VPPVTLVADWRKIASELPAAWDDARLKLTVDDETEAARAAALLGGASPFRRGKEIHLYAGRAGRGIAPDLLARLLRRLDREGIRGSLELVSAALFEPPKPPPRPSLVERWDTALAALPPDWSDAYAEVEIVSSDFVDRAALLLSPANPQRVPKSLAMRFRSARRFGYGVAPAMARRCFERIDAERILGDVRILHALSDTKPVYTQGPVWYVGGRTI